MARFRLINCDFMNNMTKVSNKAKLVYLMLFLNADDKGFVGNALSVVESLNQNTNDNYIECLEELTEKGLTYKFCSNHSNDTYLIRHWYYHNKYTTHTFTNYKKYLDMVELVDNEYQLKEEKPFKEKKINEMKLNENKINENNGEDSLIENVQDLNTQIWQYQHKEEIPEETQQELNDLFEELGIE